MGILTGLCNAGNGLKYSVSCVKKLHGSPLEGKKIVFLGSSVTQGAMAGNTSFVDYLQKRHSLCCVKEAVSGTTLTDTGPDSYVQRMLNNLGCVKDVDCFICQLSTNDASQNLPLGRISESMDPAGFDVRTITGAMEFIIAHARKAWNCPVAFYTGTWYDCPAYDAMVTRLLELRQKWGFGVINLWDDGSMNATDDKLRKLYMNDGVHPTKAGYLHWWTPRFEEFLYGVFRGHACPEMNKTH